MDFFESGQFGLLAEGWVELIGPILIFGIYIIGSIAKNVAQKNQGTEEQDQSELKKAVQKRCEQIRQRQLGQESPQFKRTPKEVSTAKAIREQQTRPQRVSQWDQKQRAIRQRNATLKEQRLAANDAQIPAPAQKPVVEYHRPKPSKIIRQVAVPKPVPVQKKRQSPKKVAKISKQRSATDLLQQMMNQPENLRMAIILKEILDRPLALRDI